MARPLKQIDEKTVFELAKILCTMKEIATIVGCSVDTLENRFSDTIKSAQDHGRSSLRRWQYHAAEKGNTTMLIWLGKQWLGQSDKQEIQTKDVTVQQAMEQQLESRLTGIIQQVSKRNRS